MPLPMCDCSHDLNQHAFPRSLSPMLAQVCLVEGCDCPGFRNVDLATKVKPETGDGQ